MPALNQTTIKPLLSAVLIVACLSASVAQNAPGAEAQAAELAVKGYIAHADATDAPRVVLGGEVGNAAAACVARLRFAPFDSLPWLRAATAGKSGPAPAISVPK